MAKYDFDAPVNRFGTNSVKYDEMPNADTIALWVADMDFETAPIIRQALAERMKHGCFGYTFVPDSYYQACIDWFRRRHGWQTERSWYIYTSGVVPAISAIIKAVVGEQRGRAIDNPHGNVKILVQTPVYNCFFSNIRNNACEVLESPLVYREKRYEVDWEDFERKLSEPDVKIFLLCNPHNPAGRVWSKEELQRMGELCKRHGVFVIADEIHCEFVNKSLLAAEGRAGRYTPFASVSDALCAVCVSPSKAFNIAGLQIANIIVSDEAMRERVDRAINVNEVCDVNPFGVIALQAAYTPEGEEWLCQLNDYIYSNYDYACQYFSQHFPQAIVTQLEGTYLMWVDFSAYGPSSDELADRLLHEANVCVNAGTMYGEEAGRKYIRINLAIQRARLEEGFRRMAMVLE